MPRMNRILRIPAIYALMTVLIAGCANMNNTEKGAVVGGASGAGLGAIIGHQVGHKGAGALIGGAAGTLLGGSMGKAKDNAEERDMYAAHAAHQEATRNFEQNAMNNYDIIKMSQSNLPDSQIINSIKQRGGKFDMSTDGLIHLNKSGVSDHVVSYMQQNARY